MKMKAAVLREYSSPLTIEEVELQPPKEKEVLVRTVYTGLCHSDLSMAKGNFKCPLPLVIGHEAAGIVEAVGSGVRSLQVGDHVVTTWAVACGECPECRRGDRHLCRTNLETQMVGGLLDRTSRLKDARGAKLNHHLLVSGFAEYMVVPEEGTFAIDKSIPLDQACVLGCCLPTGFGAVYNAAGVKPGETVAVWGMGGVGLNVVYGAKVRGGDPIIAVDVEESKEQIARDFGATHFINSSKEDPVPIIQELTGGGARYCFEVAGDTGAQLQAYWAMGLGGKLITVGVPMEGEMTQLPLTYNSPQCKSIIGTVYGNIHVERDVPVLAKMISKGFFPIGKLVTNKFRIEDINNALEAMTKREIIGRWVCEWG
jgi:S-(hydroxymethyl)glutathione dehydrogenase / alcohol dehydrogenase